MRDPHRLVCREGAVRVAAGPPDIRPSAHWFDGWRGLTGEAYRWELFGRGRFRAGTLLPCLAGMFSLILLLRSQLATPSAPASVAKRVGAFFLPENISIKSLTSQEKDVTRNTNESHGPYITGSS